MSNVEQYLRRLELSQSLREPVIRTAIESLRLPVGSFGLDVGCGIGLYTLLLAEAVGSAGHVIGLDITKEFLAKARSLSSKSNIGNRISFKEGDACKLPFDENTFDWAGSMDFAGYAPLDPVLLLKEMGRVVKPEGRVFLLIWSSQKLLSGFPMLEARLNATSSGIAPFTTAMNPESHMMRGLGWFRRAGLMEPEARTFVRDVCPPLGPEIRTALTDLFQMRWEEVDSEVSPEDWAEYQRLCSPDLPDFILNVPDYYAFFTYTLFCGRVV
ncbi:methyltransferase domain-containing protein [Desulfoscipio gibsoniae]|uniref:Methylase involved in ubiquinone/menaquinone biosynthesis n=1 Tax=Desulfoscipio gibsoniae DSM 7213 TaxID=767817 RepID=R4KL67_9FIRM|nr:class I SAM-dependent methyltransferase [Desulfoscipio gibsoniae]AGL00381.1 methylase involved in ubiquinone/menaquinone biosynthesis [Desulfoscipio gibsoniae DSM 7213]